MTGVWLYRRLAAVGGGRVGCTECVAISGMGEMGWYASCAATPSSEMFVSEVASPLGSFSMDSGLASATSLTGVTSNLGGARGSAITSGEFMDVTAGELAGSPSGASQTGDPRWASVGHPSSERYPSSAGIENSDDISRFSGGSIACCGGPSIDGLAGKSFSPAAIPSTVPCGVSAIPPSDKPNSSSRPSKTTPTSETASTATSTGEGGREPISVSGDKEDSYHQSNCPPTFDSASSASSTLGDLSARPRFDLRKRLSGGELAPWADLVGLLFSVLSDCGGFSRVGRWGTRRTTCGYGGISTQSKNHRLRGGGVGTGCSGALDLKVRAEATFEPCCSREEEAQVRLRFDEPSRGLEDFEDCALVILSVRPALGSLEACFVIVG